MVLRTIAHHQYDQRVSATPNNTHFSGCTYSGSLPFLFAVLAVLSSKPVPVTSAVDSILAGLDLDRNFLGIAPDFGKRGVFGRVTFGIVGRRYARSCAQDSWNPNVKFERVRVGE